MKKFSKILMSMFAAMCLWACSDETNEPQQTNAKNDVYVEFSVKILQGDGARSETTENEDNNGSNSSDGSEVGQAYENKVSQILLVLTKADGTYLTSETLNVTPDDNGNYPNNKVALDRSAMENYTQGIIYAYAFCNPVSAITKGNLLTSSQALAGKPALRNNDEIWKDNAFLMSNHHLCNAANSTETSVWNWGNYTETKPLNLGTIRVERSCARFDFKSNKQPSTETTDNTYTIEPKNNVKVQLTDMVMVNINKNFYHLRRVSDDGLPTGSNFALCGTETPNNYVVDTDATNKNGYTENPISWTEKRTNFYNNFEAFREWWNDFTPLASLTDEDNDDSWNNDKTRNGYKIWRYTTENTIPGIANQKNGISTGVIFKGHLVLNDTQKATYGITDTDKRIYVYKNILYGTWAKVAAAAQAPNADPALKAAYEQVGATINQNSKPGQAGFTTFSPNTEGKYEMLYFYWNRHNDNNNPNIMGTMEFAVVRNNVYKLMVNNIKGYGHPLPWDPTTPPTDPNVPQPNPDPDPDPDPIDPDNPDERNDLYIEVNVEVLPWVVRINDIEF